MEKVVIIGCGGMLGRDVYRKFSRSYDVSAYDIDVNEDWLEYGDIGDYDQMKRIIQEKKPSIIINLAAETDLEFCEANQDTTYYTNALGAENLGFLANSYDATYVYVSTAGIFGGEQDSFNDFDLPNPLSIYAKAKYHGEVYTKTTVKKHYIVRAGWMMGGGKKDKKFISKIYRQVLDGKKELFVVDDKLGTPTYTKDFADNMFHLVSAEEPYGLYNSVCNGDASRYDVAVEMVKILELDVKVTKVESDYFKEEYYAPRPYSEKLVNFKLKKRGINIMRDWEVCLEAYLNSDDFREIK